jgi:hypothetical protein
MSWKLELRTSNGGSSFCGDEELAWCFRFHIVAVCKWGTTHVKFNVLPFMVKNQGVILIGCA